METFVLAIELLAEKDAPCEVAFIGTGERDTTLGRILWRVSQPMSRIRERKSGGPGSKENRPRRVAIAEICSEDKIAYALEIGEPIRSTQFSSWLVTTLRESVPANCKHSCCCALSGVGESRKIKCRATGARPRPIAN
jgi:hypothetical protein